MEGLKNKSKLKDLSLEFQDSEIPTIDQIYDPNELLTTLEIYMPELKQLSLNFLRCGWSFKLVILILVQIGSSKCKSKHLPNFNSLNVYVCNQQLEDTMLYHFSSTVNNLYCNAAELTLTFDDCDLDAEKCATLFNFNLTQLRNIDLSLSENIELNMKSISVFIANQSQLQYLGLKFKNITQPIRDFGYLGSALKNRSLKIFNLYFEQSQLSQPRSLENFYDGLSSQDSIESITLHLHNIDHSTSQIKKFAKKLQYMNKLISLNLHLPNSMLRKEEINQISISVGHKPFLKELILEFYKNEIIYKNGQYFARSIATLNNLQKLDFSLMRCEILPSTAEKLCFSVGELKQLRKLHLYLGENNINSFTLVSLAYSMNNLSNIVNLKINLQDTSIGDDGILSLSQGMLQLKNIIILDLNLENTDIEQESLIKLGRYFRENTENLQQLELNLRNNTAITEDGFRSLMQGIGETRNVAQIVVMFNHCLMNQAISSHLPLFLQNKDKLKYLQIYFDENQLERASAKVLGEKLKSNCPKLKRFTLCVQLNQLGNEGVNDLFDGIFQMPELQKATIDVRQNEINNKNTLIKMGAAIGKCKKIKDLELLVFENQEFHDRQISKGLYALAQAELNLFQQMDSFDVRNQNWKEDIKNTFIPITTRMISHMQIVAFHNYLSPILHYNEQFTIWDLYLP